MRLGQLTAFGSGALLVLVCFAFSLNAVPVSAQTGGGTGWNVIYNKKKNECVVARKMDDLTIFFEPNFDGGKRNAIFLTRNDWDFTETIKPVRVELVGLGKITMLGHHVRSQLILVFPEKESKNARILVDALGRTKELRVTSDQLAEGDTVAVAVDGFAAMLDDLSTCEETVQEIAQLEQEIAQLEQRDAQIDQELAQKNQELCAASLSAVTWLTELTSDYDVEQRSRIDEYAADLESCGQPRVAGSVRAAMLDQNYDRASALAAAACDGGQVSGCHFGALIAAYGNNPRIAPGEGQRRMQGLCDDGFALSCEVIEVWAR